ncbi:MAG: heparan-alpha-glucosaminide N-acetyltransferase domain-containing protein [Acidimicrobiia bacterium]
MKRIVGLDVARAVAMVGMVIAHYVEQDAATGLGGTVRDFVDGRAMPLFVLLGGIGVTLLISRSESPDLALLTRALILFPLGLALQEATTDIAIILQYYSVFFLLAIGLRRLPAAALLPAAVVMMITGAFTNQILSPPTLPSYGGWEGLGSLADPGLWWAILVNGYYPFLPAGAFFIVGMWLGRQRLGDIALPLVWAGTALALIGSWIGAFIGEQVGALPDDTTADGFRWQALFDATGHSEMPAWVIGATGTALVVIGVSILATQRWQLRPLVVLGQMALTFYVFQAVVINWTPPRPETTTGEEYLLAAGLTIGFLVFAFGWVTFVARRGPLELMLRAGTPSRRQLSRSPG